MPSPLPTLLLLLPGLLLLGCSAPPGSGRVPPRWPDAAGDIADPTLAALATDLWEEMLRSDPVQASALGDERFLGTLRNFSPGAQRSRRERIVALQARADAVSPDALSSDDRITLELLREELQRMLILQDAGFERWVVDSRSPPHVDFFNLVVDQPSATREEQDAMVDRWATMAVVVNILSSNLLIGLKKGLVANRASVESTIEQLDRVLAQDTDEWPLSNPPLYPTMPAAERRQLIERVRRPIKQSLRPALENYRAVLADRILPAARGDDHPGLSSLPGGAELYEQLIWVHTGLHLTAQEVHDIGLQEVASIRAQMSALGQKVFGTSDLPEIQRRLREDPALHFATRDEVEASAVASLDRARAAIPQWFGLLPKADCVVERIGEHEERETTIAYYREPAADGSHPGRYYINTYAPETRPRYEAEVLAFHESIPGHHLQIAIAQERSGLPRFRRSGGTNAYVEGWALYTEQLADEMGLYSGDLDRLGMLSFDAWRACRLVVDTGLHALGWSRQQAIDYMVANTLLAPNNVENEVDRYITTPGQALAYKLGQREILALRAQAEQALGPRFDIGAFHDVVLGSGAVSLSVLRRNVEAWIAARAPSSEQPPL
jgi:uncharacterized protein (DUF885 family)